MQQSPVKKGETRDLEEVREGNGIWPYRVVEDDRISYFQSKTKALNYHEQAKFGRFEFYVLPRWYSV